MTITITEILDLALPLFIHTAAATRYYIEAERLITLSQSRDTEASNLYDIIIASIGDSQISNAKGTKTWFSGAYEREKNRVGQHNAAYYLRLVSFVGRLQLLVLDRYDSVDDFYQEEGITVSQVFADISEEAGYPISPQYIEDIS